MTPTPQSSVAGEAFATHLEQAGSGPVSVRSERAFRDLPGYGRVEVLRVTETHVGPDGKTVNTVKELAVCPECGTANCACLSRVTLQARIDEENANGVRNQEKPAPYSLVPQSFNQLSANFNARLPGNAPPRMFG
jgi:hypothetical protein